MIGPFGTDKRQADGQGFDKPHGHGEVWVAGDGGQLALAGAAVSVSSRQIGRPRRTIGGADQKPHAMRGQQAIDSFFTGQLAGCLQGLPVGGVIQTVLTLAQLERLLLKPSQLPFGVRAVKGDQV